MLYGNRTILFFAHHRDMTSTWLLTFYRFHILFVRSFIIIPIIYRNYETTVDIVLSKINFFRKAKKVKTTNLIILN